jgi:hypothetical protein
MRAETSKNLLFQSSNFDVLVMGQGGVKFSPDPEKVYV